jgi:hypothetical protein
VGGTQRTGEVEKVEGIGKPGVERLEEPERESVRGLGEENPRRRRKPRGAFRKALTGCIRYRLDRRE